MFTTHLRRFGIAFLGCLLCAGALPLLGQGATATVLGTVADMSGGAVPDASVVLKNTQTGASQTATSDAQGRFRVPELPVGNYDAQATKAGFSTVVRKGITLTVGAQTVVDFSLTVGQQVQTVTVEGQVSQVETTNAAIGAYTSQQQIAELPLNGRNMEQLIQLSPGVAPVTLTAGAMQGRALQYSVAGGRPEGQAILLDDENLQNFWNNGMGSVTGSSLGVEAIGEFQTLTNAYGAQFGGNGAVINAVSKSGTNSFHGSAFDYLRNSALDARDFFVTKSSPPPFRRNQFGGSVGGPVKKDKAFFFVDYEGVRQFLEENKTATVPACNVPGVCTPSASLSAAQATAIANTLALYPKPDSLINATTGLAAQYGGQINHENYVLTRFDYILSEKDSLFLRYYRDQASFTEPFGGAGIAGGGPLLDWNELDGSTSHFATLEERHLFSPAVVNLARVSFSRPQKDSLESTIASTSGPIPIGTSPCGQTVTYCPQTPLQYWPGVAGNFDGLFEIQSGGYTNLGGSAINTFNLTQNRYTAADDILWTRGAHSLRFGASFSRSQANTWNPLKSDSIWIFSSLAAALTGTAASVEGVIPSPTNYANRDYRQNDFAPYVQDDWKISPKLTVNLGLRWEFYSNPTALHGGVYEIANIHTSTGFTQYNTVFGTNPSWHDFDPRVGIAYDPFADHKTSIRAGFGMFHDPIVGLDYQIGLQTNPPWLDTLLPNPTTYPNPPVGNSPPTATQGWSRDTNTTPYVEQYNLSIQREVAPNTILTLAYVGSHGVHLFTGVDVNPPIPTINNGVYQFGALAVPGNAFSYAAFPRINPNFGPYVDMKTITTSQYNSLQVQANRRFSQNFQATVNYTYSKCMDDGALGVGSINGSLNQTPANLLNPYNQSIDHAVCSYDLTNVLRTNGLYALPFHKNRVVSGWQLTGIVSKYSGTPFTVGTGFSNTVDPGGDTARPNYVGGCDAYAGAKTVQEWFNTACYVAAAPGFLGTSGRNTLRGPGFFDMDLGLLKDTKLTESVKLQFRAEVFNIFNHENFATPAAPAVGPTGGLITASNQGTTPRQIQFALKVLF